MRYLIGKTEEHWFNDEADANSFYTQAKQQAGVIVPLPKPQRRWDISTSDSYLVLVHHISAIWRK